MVTQLPQLPLFLLHVRTCDGFGYLGALLLALLSFQQCFPVIEQ